MATLNDTVIDDNGYLKLPTGSTVQRPSSPSAGYMRYNTSTSNIEIYNGTSWANLNTSTIITSNLVVHLDASDISSYSGTGTTINNLVDTNYTHTLYGTSASEIKDGVSSWNFSSGQYALGNWVVPSTYTMEAWAWAKSDAQTTTWRTLFRTTPDDHPLLIQDATDTIGYYDNNVAQFVSYGTTAAVQGLSNSWAHIVLVGTGGTQLLYINGGYVGTVNYNAAGTTTNAVGSTQGGSQPYGWISQVRYYSTALTATEVLQNFNTTKTPFGF